jgi:hypothetical protein
MGGRRRGARRQAAATADERRDGVGPTRRGAPARRRVAAPRRGADVDRIDRAGAGGDGRALRAGRGLRRGRAPVHRVHAHRTLVGDPPPATLGRLPAGVAGMSGSRAAQPHPACTGRRTGRDRLPCRILGASVPADALVSAVRQLTPRTVFIWAHSPATARLPDLQAVQRRPLTPVVVGGPGWHRQSLPASVTGVDSLAAAVEAVSHELIVSAS